MATKAVDQYDLEGNFIKRYKSVTEASKSFYGYPSSISYCLNGHKDTAFGYKWKRANVNNVVNVAKVFHLNIMQEFKLDGYEELYRFSEENILEVKLNGKWQKEDDNVILDLIKGEVTVDERFMQER